MSSLPTETHMPNLGAGKKRRATFTKDMISRPKLLPLGSGYGLVDTPPPARSFFDTTSTFGDATGFDRRYRGHRRNQSEPVLTSPTHSLPVRRSNTLFSRFKIRKSTLQAMTRRYLDSTKTTQGKNAQNDSNGITFLIPAFAVDKPLPSIPASAPGTPQVPPKTLLMGDAANEDPSSSSAGTKCFVRISIIDVDNNANNANEENVDAPIGAIKEDDEWVQPMTKIEVIAADGHEEVPDHTPAASIPGSPSPSIYSSEISLDDIPRDHLVIEEPTTVPSTTNWNKEAFIFPQVGLLFDESEHNANPDSPRDVDADECHNSIGSLALSMNNLMLELLATCADEKTGQQNGDSDEMKIILHVKADGAEDPPFVIDDAKPSGPEKAEKKGDKLGFPVKTNEAGKKPSVVSGVTKLSHARSPSAPNSTEGQRGAAKSALRSALFSGVRERKDSETSLFKNHSFVVRRQSKHISEQDAKRLSRRRKGVTLLCARDYERLEAEMATPDGSFVLERGAKLTDEPEEMNDEERLSRMILPSWLQ